jgi:hypothetical protein
MRINRSNVPTSKASEEPMQRFFSPKSIADLFGLIRGMLQSWRMTDVGPPYFKMSRSERARVRYKREDVREWQKKCLRVVPEVWQPNEECPHESMPTPDDKIEWLPPKQTAIAIGISIPTLTAWRRRSIGLPFIWIGGGGAHQVMYDRRDIEVFISRRQDDPSVTPVIVKKVQGKDPRTLEERAKMSAQIWKEMGHSDEEIRRRLGPRAVKMIWPQ